MADDTLPAPLGWAIVDCNGIAQDFGRRLRDQPWGVIEQHPPSPARVASLDEDAPHRAPHRVVAVHDEDTVRRLLAEARAQEREACAKLCDPEPVEPWDSYTARNNKATMRLLAQRIRARNDMEADRTDTDTPRRSIRLTDADWAELQRRGLDALRQWLRGPG